MKHLKTYKIFESKIDDYNDQSYWIKRKFYEDTRELRNKFNDDVDDCMHEITDHEQWNDFYDDENEGEFFRHYMFSIPVQEFDDFVKALNDSMSKLTNHLGVLYEIIYVSAHEGMEIGDIDQFNEKVPHFKDKCDEVIRLNKTDTDTGKLAFRILIGERGR